MSHTILSSTYFGPIQWYQKLNRYDLCRIERYDHYVKQTYRNRCIIASANGPLALTVPIERGDSSSTSRSLMKDIRISDHGNWRHIHWQALVSAYGESPFFEYYADDLRPFFERRWDFLFDFNLEITQCICSLLDVRTTLMLTDEYRKTDDLAYPMASPQLLHVGTSAEDVAPLLAPEALANTPCDDFRDIILPKNAPLDPSFDSKPYYQVYRHKYDFQHNLSILDLLLNEGNAAICWL